MCGWLAVITQNSIRINGIETTIIETMVSVVVCSRTGKQADPRGQLLLFVV